jgi:2-polyprenyl-3-methyl-5-hydroxy-6-metoxy-1,4-benzoquinol methylase
MDTKEYWEKRLRIFCNLEGVGCIGFDSYFNSYIYKAIVRTIERVSRKFKISLEKKEVLDVGSGMGFWVDYYLTKGARLIYGVDITSYSIRIS